MSESTRRKLPDEHESTTIHFTVTSSDDSIVDGYLQPGFHEDGTLGALFVKIANNPDINSHLEAWAKLFSLALQHGVPVTELCNKFIGWHGTPAGRVTPAGLVTGDDQKMPTCLSIQDLVCRFLRKRYGKAVEVAA